MNKVILNNEEGSVIVLALIILILLTIIGVSSTTTSSIESQIIINDRLFRQSFYKAESGALEAAQEIKNNAGNNPSQVNPNVAGAGAGLGYIYGATTTNLRNISNMTSLAATASSIPGGSVLKAATFTPGTRGGSLDITKSQSVLCDFEAHGYDNSNGGKVHIMIGFKTRVLYQ